MQIGNPEIKQEISSGTIPADPCIRKKNGCPGQEQP